MTAGLFGFEGRIGRGGWWFAQLVILLIFGVLFAAALALHTPKGSASNNDAIFLPLLIACLLAALTVNLCSTVKRFHDRGKSGWWFLIGFVPLIGTPWILIECGMLPGEDCDNDYGSPPGAEQRRASLDQEISGIAKSNGKLSKLDDNYIADYAKNIAMQQAKQQMAAAASFGQSGPAKPAFGKR